MGSAGPNAAAARIAPSPYLVEIMESTATGEEIAAAVLPLGTAPSAPDVAGGAAGRSVHADRRAWFRIRLNPAVSAEEAAHFALAPENVFGQRTTIELCINGEVVPSRQSRDGSGAVCLWPTDEPAPFLELIGFAAVSFWVRPPDRFRLPGGEAGEENYLYAAPVLVLLPADGTGARLQRMGEFIYQKAPIYLGRGMKASAPAFVGRVSEAEDSVQARLKPMRTTLRVYEMTQGYFHANARFKYVEADAVAPFERMRALTPETAAWIAERPDELLPSESPTGIGSPGRWWRPKHVLAASSRRDHAIAENLAVAGFLRRIVLDAQDLGARIRALIGKYERGQGEQYVSTMDAVFRARAKTLKAALEELGAMTERFERLFAVYLRMLGLAAEDVPALAALPEPCPAFASIPAYSMVYERMREWFALPPIALEREEKLLVFSEGPQLYEVYVLLRMLDALSSLGFAFLGAERFEYPTHKGLAKNAEIENTFAFAAGGIGITLYYQPFIRGQDANLTRPENGIGLIRTTSFNFASPEKPTEASRPQHAYYTPDFLLKIETQGRSFYVIADAKLSSAATILHKRLGELVFKYAFSIAPIRAEDTLAGLHFFCGRTPRETELDLSGLDETMRSQYFAEGRAFLVQDIAFGRGVGVLPALSICTLSESGSCAELREPPAENESADAAEAPAASAYEQLDPEAFMPTAVSHLLAVLDAVGQVKDETRASVLS